MRRPVPASCAIWLGVAFVETSLPGLAWSGQPSPDLPCTGAYSRAGARQYGDLLLMPAAAVAELVRHFGRAAATPADIAEMIAPRDADWEVGDALGPKPLPGRRFIQGIGSGNRLLIWYERGGIAHTYQLAILDASGSSGGYRLIADLQGSLESLCHTAETRFAR